MTTWNYRVIKKSCSHTREVTYQIHEIFYNEDGSIDCWSDNPVEPLGVSEPGLRNDIRSFLSAFRLPVLEEHFINGKACLISEHLSQPAKDLQVDYANKATKASGYIYQVLGNHLLLKHEPALRRAYEKVDQALVELFEMASTHHSEALEN